MDFLSSQQVSTDSLETVEYDLYIAVSGYQEYCTFLPENINVSARRKVVLSYDNKNNFINKNSGRYFRDNAFELIEIPLNHDGKLSELLKDFFSSSKNQQLSILIDYSCMPHRWYSAIINTIQESESQIEKIEIYFTYSARKYLELPKSKIEKNPNPGFSMSSLSVSKPIVLIVGLGLDKYKATYVIKYLQPNRIILMYADPAIDENYTYNVFNHNEEIIHKTEPRDLINFPLKDANAINEIITQKCVELRLNYNVIIAPMGPRIFALNSYLLANRYPDIFVWDFGIQSLKKAPKSIPSGDIIAQLITFVDEDEY